MAELNEDDMIIKIANYINNVANNPGTKEPFRV